MKDSGNVAAGELKRSEWPAVARRIREGRERAGLSQTEIAQRIGIASDSVRDLESYDDEGYRNVSLRELEALGRMLRVEPRVLLLGSEAADRPNKLTFADISSALSKRLAEQNQTAD